MRVKPRKQRFQNYVPFESVIFLGREIQYETICPVDLDMFLSIITMMMMIITVHLRATSLQRPFFFWRGGGGGGGGRTVPTFTLVQWPLSSVPKWPLQSGSTVPV